MNRFACPYFLQPGALGAVAPKGPARGERGKEGLLYRILGIFAPPQASEGITEQAVIRTIIVKSLSLLAAIVLASGVGTAHLHAEAQPALGPDGIPMAPQDVRPATIGSRADPSLALCHPDGSATNLGAVTGGAPTVIIFYRGGWCPFCSAHLSGLGAIVPDLTTAGWKIVAITPEQPAVLSADLGKGDSGIPRFSDAKDL